MSYGPRLDEFLAERRAHGIHGEEAARMLADPQRYELPETDEDLDELMMLVVEQGAFPRRLGRVGGLYVDVTMGWRTTASAVRLLQSESTAENAPAHYCAHLSGLAINLGRIGRSAEGIALARLVLAAAETAYGQATPEWLDAGCGFVQTSLLRTDPNDPLLSETESVLDTLLRDAPPLGRKRDLARVLALAGHYFWTKGAHNDGSYEYELLQQAESNLASAADLRGGPERGRTLASLAQVRADLAREGLVAPEAQTRVKALAAGPGVTLLCGRYEGVDERVIEARGVEELSLGDFVLSGGEPAAIALIDACVRLLPGVVGDEATLAVESFEGGLLEYPHYTRPQDWEGRAVPEVLLSGHHDRIRQWRQEQREKVTRERRPDLWDRRLAQGAESKRKNG